MRASYLVDLCTEHAGIVTGSTMQPDAFTRRVGIESFGGWLQRGTGAGPLGQYGVDAITCDAAIGSRGVLQIRCALGLSAEMEGGRTAQQDAVICDAAISSGERLV